VKSKTYTQNKQPSDKTQSSKFCQLGDKRTRFQNRKKKGNDFFDRSTTITNMESESKDRSWFNRNKIQSAVTNMTKQRMF